jgi:hypothetical protein
VGEGAPDPGQPGDEGGAQPTDEPGEQGGVRGRLEGADHLGARVDQRGPEQQVREAAHAPDALVHHEVHGHPPLRQDRLDTSSAERPDLAVVAAVALGEDDDAVG